MSPILLTPEWHPRVQSVALAVPPDPDSALGQALDQLVALLNEDAAQWPPALPAAATLDVAMLMRKFRAAAAWAGRCRKGAFSSGNGETSVGIDLDGETARLILAILVDPVEHQLQQVDMTLRS